jgi:hypothetical protein
MAKRMRVGLLILGCGLLAGCDRSAAYVQEVKPAAVVAEAPPAENKPAEPEPFRFPDDRGGALAARLLPPAGNRPLPSRTTEPVRTPVPPSLESPTAPLPPSVTQVVRLPAEPPRRTLRPRLIGEEPLAGSPLDLGRPQIPPLAVGERTRERSLDINQPPPLPLLAQPLPDSPSLEDATLEASLAAVVSAPPTGRTAPVPFQRAVLPDPYEFRGRLPPAPDEEATPTTAAPQRPTP